MEYNLLQEYNYKLVVHIKLNDLEGGAIPHFVTWDGKLIINTTHIIKVNNKYDHTNPKKSNLVFKKFFPKADFSSWKITSIYQLVY